VRYASPTVTVCIAAKALAPGPIRADEGDFHSAIVLCMDMMGSTDYSSAENTAKHCFLPHGFTALISGTVPVAREFSAIVSEELQRCAVDLSEIIARLRRSMTIQKQRHADEHLGARVGMSYADFQETGGKALPEDLYRDLAWEIRNQFLEIELIVAGFVGHQSVIIKLSGEKVMICDHYAVIGSGTLIAEASLLHREHSELCRVDLATYRAYEAKRLSERALGVGRATSIMALHDSEAGTMLDLFHQERLPLLEQEFQRFGPKPVSVNNLAPLPEDAYFRVPGTPDQWQKGDALPPKP
jgi:hypothetical protein